MVEIIKDEASFANDNEMYHATKKDAKVSYDDILNELKIADWVKMEAPPIDGEYILRKSLENLDYEIWNKITLVVDEFLSARCSLLKNIDVEGIIEGNNASISSMMKFLPVYLQTHEDMLKRLLSLADNPDYADDIFDSGIIEAAVNFDFDIDEFDENIDKRRYPKPYFFAPIVLDQLLLADTIRKKHNEMVSQYTGDFAQWLKMLAMANLRQSFVFATRYNNKTYRYKLGVEAGPTATRQKSSEIHLANLSRHIISEYYSQASYLNTNKNSGRAEFNFALIGDIDREELRQLCISLDQDFEIVEIKTSIRVDVKLSVYTNTNKDTDTDTDTDTDIEGLLNNRNANFEYITIVKEDAVKKSGNGLRFDKLDGLEKKLLSEGHNAILFFDNSAFYKVRTLTTDKLKEFNAKVYQDSHRNRPLWIQRVQLMQYEASGEYGFSRCRRFNNRLFKQIRKMAERLNSSNGASTYIVLSGSDCAQFIMECPEIYQEYASSDEWDMATRVTVLRVSTSMKKEPIVLNPDDEEYGRADYNTLKLSPSQIFRRIIEPGKYQSLFSDDAVNNKNYKSDKIFKLLKDLIIQLDFSRIKDNGNSIVEFALFKFDNKTSDPPKIVLENQVGYEAKVISLVKGFLSAAFSSVASDTSIPCTISDLFSSAVMRYGTHVSSVVFLYFYNTGKFNRSSVKIEYKDNMEYIPSIEGPERRAEIAAGGDIYALDGVVRTLAIPGYDFGHEYVVKTMLKRALAGTSREGEVDRVFNFLKEWISESCNEMGFSTYYLNINAKKALLNNT
ncbi:MAG: hypothetical protein FWG88_10030 [Oscillospiraceae bacterium]|nr:hypothetical protein [Oscillospiraceae bacterium]